MAPDRIDRIITSLASTQHGVVSRDQALRAGLSAMQIFRRLESGRWERLHRGVYRIAGVPSTWRGSLLAACLTCGPAAVASHRAAARLWGCPGVDNAGLELSVPRAVRTGRGLHVHRVSDLARIDRTVLSGIPTTSSVRTVIDLAGVVPYDVFEEALDDALRRDLFTLSRFAWRVQALEKRDRHGIVALRRAIAERRGLRSGPQSLLETRTLRLLRGADLPGPEIQYRVRSGRRTMAIVDFAYPDVRLGVEADGYRWHSGRARWDHDRARANALTALGWTILRLTWSDVHERRAQTARTIEATWRRLSRR